MSRRAGPARTAERRLSATPAFLQLPTVPHLTVGQAGSVWHTAGPAVTQRLILFCSDLEVDLEEVHRSVAALGARIASGPLEVDEIEGPEAVSAKGWVTLAVRPGGQGAELTMLETHLDEMVKGCAQALREDVLGLYLDPGN